MNCVVWVFGRGASIACNLSWVVPAELISEGRLLQIEKIKAALQKEMDQPTVNTEPYKLLLSELSRRTAPGWLHRFVTTNWDYLLQREILRQPWQVLPIWLEDSHVYHLNGTVESSSGSNIPNLRSPFLLETDPIDERKSSREYDNTLQFIGWRKHFIVIGMSFACPNDRAFLCFLGKIRDVRPVGVSSWHVVDPSVETGEEVCNQINVALPGSDITVCQRGFKEWVIDGMPTLVEWGVLNVN